MYLTAHTPPSPSDTVTAFPECFYVFVLHCKLDMRGWETEIWLQMWYDVNTEINTSHMHFKFLSVKDHIACYRCLWCIFLISLGHWRHQISILGQKLINFWLLWYKLKQSISVWSINLLCKQLLYLQITHNDHIWNKTLTGAILPNKCWLL